MTEGKTRGGFLVNENWGTSDPRFLQTGKTTVGSAVKTPNKRNWGGREGGVLRLFPNTG